MQADRASNHRQGFTLIEILVTLALFVLVALLGFPALQRSIHRGKIEGFGRNSVLVMREARHEAVRRGRPCVVVADSDAGALFAYADVNRDGIFNPAPEETDLRSTDYPIRRLALPVGLHFAAPDSQAATEGFSRIADHPGRSAVFHGNGSAYEAGAYRFADERGNFLEVRVSPAATARVSIRKWDGEAWLVQDQDGRTWVWL